ncbi:hypothetical protein [Streptomyces roseolilacinus]|uniref:hypothetical protein n=1 Tax=Streptomyces roseolilacinus TaxID=66904 RepID=UPI0038123AF9
MQAITYMSNAMSEALKWAALAASYSILGLDHRADHALRMAEASPVGFPPAQTA